MDASAKGSLYNSAPVAGNNLGVKLSDAHKARLSEFRKSYTGWSHTQETRQKMAESNKARHAAQPMKLETRQKIAGTLRGRIGRKHSAESRAKMSAAQIGHVVTPKTRELISKANKGRPQTAEHKALNGERVSAARSTTGERGISIDRRNGAFVLIWLRRYVGRFKTIEEAVAARNAHIASLSCNIAPTVPELD